MITAKPYQKPIPIIFLAFLLLAGSFNQTRASISMEQIETSDFQCFTLESIATDTSKQETFKVVEQMPRFPGCEEEASENRSKCARRKMIEFIIANLNYPEKAKKTNVQGTVIVRYIVDKTGDLRDIEVVRGIGSGCDEEALKVVQMMPKWIPGKQRGKNVNVQFNLPFNFQLDEKTIKENEKRMKKENNKQ